MRCNRLRYNDLVKQKYKFRQFCFGKIRDSTNKSVKIPDRRIKFDQLKDCKCFNLGELEKCKGMLHLGGIIYNIIFLQQIIETNPADTNLTAG